MEAWQVIISFCAGCVTFLTLLEKIGGNKSFKKINTGLAELEKVPGALSSLHTDVTAINTLQLTQSKALLAILRNDLYRCFKDNRDIGAWTDEDARVQITLHEVYKALHGNGEEEIWWEKKKTWRIVSEAEYKELVAEYRRKNCEKEN